MSEVLLVTHCAPTLAGLKTGNLFNCRYDSREQLKFVTGQWNRMLNPKGVFVLIMKAKNNRALIYVYRKAKLERELRQEELCEFLRQEGYDCSSLEKMLPHLSLKLRKSENFPHEIGIFLGYPFQDVKGFIENKGKNCKCTGHWKVYNDETAARKMFNRYQKCTDVYCRKLEEGTTICSLTVGHTASARG